MFGCRNITNRAIHSITGKSTFFTQKKAALLLGTWTLVVPNNLPSLQTIRDKRKRVAFSFWNLEMIEYYYDCFRTKKSYTGTNLKFKQFQVI